MNTIDIATQLGKIQGISMLHAEISKTSANTIIVYPVDCKSAEHHELRILAAAARLRKAGYDISFTGVQYRIVFIKL